MKKNTLIKAAVVGGVVAASAVTAGVVLMKNEKQRKKITTAVDKAGDAAKDTQKKMTAKVKETGKKAERAVDAVL